MSDLNDEYVRQLAYLARISLSDEEAARLKPQLSAILAYVEQLDSVDTAGLEPTAQVTGLTHVSRGDDDTSDTMERERLLDQTPLKQDGQIKVPKVI
jgi:aspartyl-tRNA(Asn)/glutamyl-tRNA(Gln) amidotransferase subunit C